MTASAVPVAASSVSVAASSVSVAASSLSPAASTPATAMTSDWGVRNRLSLILSFASPKPAAPSPHHIASASSLSLASSAVSTPHTPLLASCSQSVATPPQSPTMPTTFKNTIFRLSRILADDAAVVSVPDAQPSPASTCPSLVSAASRQKQGFAALASPVSEHPEGDDDDEWELIRERREQAEELLQGGTRSRLLSSRRPVSLDLRADVIPVKADSLRRSHSLWVHTSSTGADDMLDTEPTPALRERQRSVNVWRARKMVQLFGDNPPSALFQITTLAPPQDMDEDRASLATILSATASTVSAATTTPNSPTSPTSPHSPTTPNAFTTPSASIDLDAHTPASPTSATNITANTSVTHATDTPTPTNEAPLSSPLSPTEDMDPAAFRARRLRAAKLARFFGVGMRDLVEVLPQGPPRLPSMPARAHIVDAGRVRGGTVVRGVGGGGEVVKTGGGEVVRAGCGEVGRVWDTSSLGGGSEEMTAGADGEPLESAPAMDAGTTNILRSESHVLYAEPSALEDEERTRVSSEECGHMSDDEVMPLPTHDARSAERARPMSTITVSDMPGRSPFRFLDGRHTGMGGQEVSMEDVVAQLRMMKSS